MTLCYSRLLGAALLATSLTAVDPAITFSGVLRTGETTRIALTDTARNSTSWVEPGQDFNGYKVDRYDPKDDAVYLKKGGQETRLSLATAKSEASLAASTPNTTPSGENSTTRAAVASTASADKIAPAIAASAAAAATPAESTVPGSNLSLSGVTPPSVPRPAEAAPLPNATVAPASPAYTTRSGDTWQKISEQTGIAVPQLRALNPAILDGSPLPAGQTVRTR